MSAGARSLFSNYLIVDWSASSVPKTGADSIWLGWLERHRDGRWIYGHSNPDTRAKAFHEIRSRLADAVKQSRATLAGFDFPLGYPGRPWRVMWTDVAERVTDRDNNANDRFEAAALLNRRLSPNAAGPFWGCPANRKIDGLTARKPPAAGHGFAEMRIADAWQSGPQSPWKLYGAGSAGGQALTGIPRAWRLREDPALAPHTRVWPFETGLAAPFGARPDQPRIVLAEVWPSLLRPQGRADEVKDQAQVRSLAEHFARLDQDGRLARLFAGPRALDRPQREKIEREEGWILGVL